MNKRKIYITLTILSIVFLCIGGTFSLVTSSIVATNITQIKSGNLTMTISGGGNQSVSFVPSECTGENTIKKTIVAKATNTSGGKVSFSIGFNITALSANYKKDTVRYILSTTANNCAVGIVAGGTFKDKTVGDDVWLIKNDYDNITKSGNTYTKTYYLYIWLDKSETEYFEGNISVKLKGSTSNNPSLPVTDDYNDGNSENTLFYKIKSGVDKYTRIDFSKQSSDDGTNGIYITTNTDNGVPVYYYRGNVDNHLIFANFCWRIVRTTETGGVKLIYDGVPNNGQCNNTESATTIGNSAFNLINFPTPTSVGYMYGEVYGANSKTMSSLSGSIVFGNDITYTNGIYTLKDTYTLTDVSNWSTEYTKIASKYHYTCFTSSNTCEKVNYIHSTLNTTSYYFELSDGKNHLDILKEMVDDSSNTNNSKIKTTIDTWYKNKMTSYTSQLEDTVFCNDRSYDISKTGWNKDYSNSGNNYLYFNGNRRDLNNRQPSLICPSINDKFTVNVNNGNGALTYPVGLLTTDEVAYAGGKSGHSNSTFYLFNNQTNWDLTPSNFSTLYAFEFILPSASYSYAYSNVTTSFGVRPVISLKKGTILSSGNGTATSPYIVG